MTVSPQYIAALLGSRICHDLVSPLGAIANGVELLQMSGEAGGPEIDLITESVENANARIRFFRIAYGLASVEQIVDAREVKNILDGLSNGGRLKFNWQSDGDYPRSEIKLVFLMLQCFETAMPWGGEVTVTMENHKWRLGGTSDRLKIDPALWSHLTGDHDGSDISASQVQFLLFRALATEAGHTLMLQEDTAQLTVQF